MIMTKKNKSGDRKDTVRRHITIGGIVEFFAGGEVEIKSIKKFCAKHHMEIKELSKEHSDKFECAYSRDGGEFMFASFAGQRQPRKTLPPKIDPRDLSTK
jgi:hypothetical protein